MIPRHSRAAIEEMRPVGAFVASVLTTLKSRALPGVNLLELDALAHTMIKDVGAESCYIDYHPSFGGSPFGKVLCTSVNDAALHGLPHDYTLQQGDLLSLDFAVSLHGWVADSALTLVAGGHPTPEDQRLIDTCEKSSSGGNFSRALWQPLWRYIRRDRSSVSGWGIPCQYRLWWPWRGPHHALRPIDC